jgi:hypothetical protein
LPHCSLTRSRNASNYSSIPNFTLKPLSTLEYTSQTRSLSLSNSGRKPTPIRQSPKPSLTPNK